MPFHGVLTGTDWLLERALDGVAERQRVSAHNIANANTPGYKRYRLPFEDQLKAALAREDRRELIGATTHPGHIPIRSGSARRRADLSVERVGETSMRNDGNNVDIEAEMAQIIKDQVHYNALAQEVAKRYSMLRDAITEGRR